MKSIDFLKISLCNNIKPNSNTDNLDMLRNICNGLNHKIVRNIYEIIDKRGRYCFGTFYDTFVWEYFKIKNKLNEK